MIRLIKDRSVSTKIDAVVNSIRLLNTSVAFVSPIIHFTIHQSNPMLTTSSAEARRAEVRDSVYIQVKVT